MIKIDEKKCIGCGACVGMCPEVFEIINGKSRVKNAKACDSCDCKAAKDACPVGAISL